MSKRDEFVGLPNTDALLDALEAAGDADALLTAALITAAGGPGIADEAAARRLIRRATEVAPADREVAALAVLLCAPERPCEDESARHLRAVDADNALSFLHELARQLAASDEPSAQATLESMTKKGNRLDVYFNPLRVRATRTLATLRGRDPGMREIAAGLGLVAFSIAPDVKAIVSACGGKAPQLLRQGPCRSLPPVLLASDTLLVQAVGMAYARTYADDPDAARAARNLRRTASWRSEQYVQLQQSRTRQVVWATWFAAQSHRDEASARVAVLQEFHRPTDPPPNWENPGESH